MSRYVRVDSAMAPSPPRSARRPSAFTLVELLIVVSIIALLLTMLTPSLRRARYLTLKVICLSNMNQQHAALYNYATANRGLFPYRNEHSPDYHRQSGVATSCVSLMRGRYVTNTSVITCPIVARVPSQPYGEYRRTDWAAGSGYGGWDSACSNVYTSYMWMGGFTGGGYAVAMIGSEPPPPASTRECSSEVAFITHRLNFYRSIDLHEIAHGGRGLFQTGAPYQDTVVTEMPVLHGDSHATYHEGGEIYPRMTVGGNYPGTPGFPGTYLW
ncbi:MAG: hypothetical protein BWX88_03669 [Planctomycetes bacterium ADurb.Bin126]|nr:MAG: hypothetical protein BWX88_03669 [Planctomycetes bacterium ADurb.Bin126]